MQIPAEMIHYGMTKTAVLPVARGLAKISAGSNVTVNSVLPGPTASKAIESFVDGLAPQQNTNFSSFAPCARHRCCSAWRSPTKLRPWLHLCTARMSSATNGAALRIDGGVVRSVL